MSTSSIRNEANYEALNNKLAAMKSLSEKVLENISKHIEYYEKRYSDLIGTESSKLMKEKMLEDVENDILTLEQLKEQMKEAYYIHIIEKIDLGSKTLVKEVGEVELKNSEKVSIDKDGDILDFMVKFLTKALTGNQVGSKIKIKIGEHYYDMYQLLQNITNYKRYTNQYDTKIRDLRLLVDKHHRDKRIDDTYRSVNEINGRLMNQTKDFSSGQQTCTLDRYKKINDKKNNNLVKSLFNSTIGRLYLDYLGFEKGAISSALEGLTRSKDVVGENEKVSGVLDKIEGALAGETGETGEKGKVRLILKELGIIYGTFMVLLKRVLQETGGDLETIAFEKAFDIIGGAAEGSFKGIMHAIGQIPPFGLIFSVLSMIDTAVTTLAKTASTGMMVLDPILDMFNAATGYDTDEFKALIRNISDVKNVLMSGSSPNSGLLADSAYVDCKVDKSTGHVLPSL